jgi:hypothetical protein
MMKFYGKTGKFWLLVALATVIALGTIGVGAYSAYAKNTVPFKASISGTASATSTGFDLTGTGNAAHLGNSTYDGTVTTSNAGNGCISAPAVETLTAANGDSLFLTCTDLVVCPTTNPGELGGHGTWTVTGGTGRFSGASGQGTDDTLANPSQGVFSKTLTGSISY